MKSNGNFLRHSLIAQYRVYGMYYRTTYVHVNRMLFAVYMRERNDRYSMIYAGMIELGANLRFILEFIYSLR